MYSRVPSRRRDETEELADSSRSIETDSSGDAQESEKSLDEIIEAYSE